MSKELLNLIFTKIATLSTNLSICRFRVLELKTMNWKVDKKYFWALAGTVISVALILFGYWLGLEKQIGIVDDETNSIKGNWEVFNKAADILKTRYYKSDQLNDEDLFYGALEGLIKAAGDPYSVFFKPTDAKKFEEDINGSFGGVGAEIGIREEQLVIVAPLKNTPAEKAGLISGDKIMKIDETLTNDLSVEEAVKLIRGEEGVEVRLLIFRDGWNEAKEFKIIRAIIEVPTLDSEMKPGKILYVQLYNFNANASSLFYQAALSGLIDGAQGMVLDMRNNPGGFLDVAVDLGGWFLERGQPVVQEKFANQSVRIFRANGNQALKDLPVVVLVNEGSASASEILAGALRDKRGAKLIGKKTFGKGTVQQLETLDDGSSLKISVAEWLTPNGNSINEKGLEPDVVVEFTEEDLKANRDPQLEKALEILRNEISN